MAHLARIVVFFAAMGAGLWGFAALTAPWNWLSFVAAFLVGGVASMMLFKRLATDEQRKEDLEARLHND